MTPFQLDFVYPDEPPDPTPKKLDPMNDSEDKMDQSQKASKANTNR